MKKLLLQTDIFHEDTIQDSKSVIKKYFDVFEIGDDWPLKYDKIDDYWSVGPFNKPAFRGALDLGRRLYGDKYFSYANALKFATYFRHEMASNIFVFSDLQSLRDEVIAPCFIRPVSPFKEFAGNVFTPEAFEKECNFYVKNKNGDPYLICMVAEPVKIEKEWRCIFVNRQYISGSQYMENGELAVLPRIPQAVVEKAKELAANKYFDNVFDFVIDIGKVDGRLCLVEINGFETASFYAADLNKIYKEWSKSLNA